MSEVNGPASSPPPPHEQPSVAAQDNASNAIVPDGGLRGRKLGQYTLLEKIGHGGMGAVFKAFDTALERTVALKVLFSSSLDDAKHSERFMREARSLARLSHPNLLHIYNVGHEGDCYYFAMELLQGQTFTQALRQRKRLPAHEAIPFFGQVLYALHYVHQQGITHRDIKSSNIILCGRRAVLMDFGLAKDNHYSGMTSDGAVLGTPDYMPPEQAEGVAVGPSSDLYSLGVVMYEVLSGTLPFKGRSAISIMRQHMDIPAPPIEAELPDIDPALALIIHKCLAKKPTERYIDCPSMALDLLRIAKTPELQTLAEDYRDLAGTVPRARPLAANLKIDESALERTVIDTRAIAKSTQPHNLDAAGLDATVSALPAAAVKFQNAVSAPARKPWPAWFWVAAGFFGMLIIVALLGNALSKKQQVKTPGQLVLKRNADGTEQEIRWIEFKADDSDVSNWYHVIERRKPDGAWEREWVPHRNFGRPNDVMDFVKDKALKQ